MGSEALFIWTVKYEQSTYFDDSQPFAKHQFRIDEVLKDIRRINEIKNFVCKPNQFGGIAAKLNGVPPTVE